jgi:hypothetical protein
MNKYYFQHIVLKHPQTASHDKPQRKKAVPKIDRDVYISGTKQTNYSLR